MARSLPLVTMHIERQYFGEILAQPRRKWIEYRDMKPHWQSRLAKVGNGRFKFRLLNGMRSPVPEATIMVTRLVRDYRKRQFRLHLGRVLEVKRWNRSKEVPRGSRVQA